MFKSVGTAVWAFDIEWVPDADLGRKIYGLPNDMPELEVWSVMWSEAGATPENPRPFIKTALSKIVSIAAVARYFSRQKNDVRLQLVSLPREPSSSPKETEASIIEKFVEVVGERKPQLVGYNSLNSDLKILIQRGVAHGICARGFSERPNKPWEGYDYFSRASEGHIDLADIVGGWGKSMPSLNEIAMASGIPGKLDMAGSEVATRYLNGELEEIVAYNEFDALTTYLLWLRVAHFGGFFDDGQYQAEQERVRTLLTESVEDKPHLALFIGAWD